MSDDTPLGRTGRFAAGVLHALTLVLEMLDEKGVLSRVEAREWLAGHLRGDPASPILQPLALLIDALARPKGTGWVPTVHQGGRTEDDPEHGA